MAIVRSDRVKESQKLNRCGREAFWAYSHWLKELPDDYGRFRANPKLIASHLAPRRKDISPAVCARILAEYIAEELVQTWEVDGEVFGEFTKFRPRGNRYHRTPEPPWSEHHHQGTCAATAAHRAREWGDTAEAERLSLLIKEIRDRKRTGSPPSRHREGTPPSPPFPSVPRERVVVDAREAEPAPEKGPAPGLLDEARCPDCSRYGALKHGFKGRDYFCGDQNGGCGHRFALDDPAITRQLTPSAKAAVVTRLSREGPVLQHATGPPGRRPTAAETTLAAVRGLDDPEES